MASILVTQAQVKRNLKAIRIPGKIWPLICPILQMYYFWFWRYYFLALFTILSAVGYVYLGIFSCWTFKFKLYFIYARDRELCYQIWCGCFLLMQVYASIRSESIAIIASTLDSLLDLIAGAILWFTRYTMSKHDVYNFPIGKSRIQPVGIVIFAAIMATLGMCIHTWCLILEKLNCMPFILIIK